MSVGFGFSTGDFIAAIDLVGRVIDALRSSGHAGSEYRELISQLLFLETALIQVKELEFEESQYAEAVSLRQAAAQCRRTIDGFWDDVKSISLAWEMTMVEGACGKMVGERLGGLFVRRKMS